MHVVAVVEGVLDGLSGEIGHEGHHELHEVVHAALVEVHGCRGGQLEVVVEVPHAQQVVPEHRVKCNLVLEQQTALSHCPPRLPCRLLHSVVDVLAGDLGVGVEEVSLPPAHQYPGELLLLPRPPPPLPEAVEQQQVPLPLPHQLTPHLLSQHPSPEHLLDLQNWIQALVLVPQGPQGNPEVLHVLLFRCIRTDQIPPQEYLRYISWLSETGTFRLLGQQ